MQKLTQNKKPPTKKLKWLIVTVANIVLHSNQMWRDLREFYSLIGVFKKFYKL